MSHFQSRTLSPWRRRLDRRSPGGFVGVRFRRRPCFDLMEDRTLLSTFLVSNTDDGGTGSLRQAIVDANAHQGANAITFDPTAFATPQTITLTSGQLELSDTTGTETITGPAAGVTVSGGGNSRVFLVDANVAASISGMTITGGQIGSNADREWGGGLLNYGATTLTDCTVSGNFAFQGGGGLASGTYHNSGGSITLANCTVSGNQAYFNGGGLYSCGSTDSLTNCTVSGNSAFTGGGMDTSGGSTTLTNSIVDDNSARETGGGFNNSYGTTTITNCTISGNTAGPFESFGAAGGLGNLGGTDSLTNCTVSNNYVNGRDGGGVTTLFSGTTTLTDCTVAGNSTTGDGGGLATFGTASATLINCTVSGNSANGQGGGLWLSPSYSGTMSLGNTIVARNTSPDGPDVSGGMSSRGDNLIGETDGSSGWVRSDLKGTIASPLNPLLSPLGNYGGPTRTMALLPGSPAIDAGKNAPSPPTSADSTAWSTALLISAPSSRAGSPSPSPREAAREKVCSPRWS